MAISNLPCPNAFAEAEAEYHGRPATDYSRALLQLQILDALYDVPAQSLAAFVALDMGDDVEARERLARVRNAARLFNQMVRA